MGVVKADPPQSIVSATRSPAPVSVVLANGDTLDIGRLARAELGALHWEQEQAYARRIVSTRRGSPERAETIRDAYDTVVTIMDRYRSLSGERPFGLNPSAVGPFLRRMLRRQRAEGLSGRFFEIGFGRGTLLKWLADEGFEVGGIEPSAVLYRQAIDLLGAGYDEAVQMGTFLEWSVSPDQEPFSLLYSNDVVEHIPPDEIPDVFRKAFRLLAPGGMLVTVTPNWHRRPSDITRSWCPPRTEAKGLHLREYSLREITELLRRAGFVSVGTPLFRTRRRIVPVGNGLAWWKRLVEPSLEWLPFRAARLVCDGAALGYTMAVKARS